jgi:RND family efflux transporter MFP subunit
MPGRSFPGKVTRIATALQPDTRTLLTEIDVPNPDEDLAPGTYCAVELHIPRIGQSLIVPADAIVFDSEGLHVAVLEDGVARFRKVTVAHDLGTEVEVSAGLTKGEHVIRNPAVELVDGSRAKTQADPIKEAEN